MSNLKTVTPETISLETLRQRIEQAEDLESLCRFFGYQSIEDALDDLIVYLLGILRRRESEMLQRSQDERIRDTQSVSH